MDVCGEHATVCAFHTEAGGHYTCLDSPPLGDDDEGMATSESPT